MTIDDWYWYWWLMVDILVNNGESLLIDVSIIAVNSGYPVVKLQRDPENNWF